MKHRKILFSVVFVLVAVPAVAAIWTQIIPQYRASGEVRVRPIIPRLVFKTDDNGAIPFYEGFVNTQVSIMRSETVLQRVLDQPEVQETQWYRSPRQSLVQRLSETPDTRLERLRDALWAEPRRQTEIIDVAVTGPVVEDAMIIANAVLDQYIMYAREASGTTSDALYRQLVEQYKSLEQETAGLESICASIRKKIGTGSPNELISVRRIRLDEDASRLTGLRQRIALLELECANGTKVASKGNVEQQPRHHEDAEWRERDVTVRTISHNIATNRLESNDPEIARAKNDLKLAEQLLQLREAQLQEQWQDRLARMDGERPMSPEHQLARAKQEERLVLVALKKQQAEFSELFTTAQLFEKENSELLYKRELLDAVRQRLDQKNMERNVPGGISILARAMATSEPQGDYRILMTVIALMLATCISGIASILKIGRTQAVSS